ncbi:Nuclease SbcCD subunit C [Salinivirga cyanobacteriivorans]|uniref:Nuclease SbcCD subunit C n=1 Tax=Salinivirga cyanobacteriivorans TaxID=1307839 RepID=A0A0S2HVW2_9BACT|nr:SMC family ATPase [Salinivirga cyanobacteriivorans]ALO14206.1 Nuclease SbcCD subunit C [Salinivirga cyanobacteriivorans]
MIPETLKIKGIYSYRHEAVINFEQLTDAGLFGIFGKVGSGKSTVLEAISFAMYGETERLNNRDSKLYNMMNLRSNELEIDFTLRHLNERYRFVATARRNSKNFTEITKSERKAYHWNEGQWIPLESADATEIIGLRYEHFKQIVIIPQGKFNEFVQLSASDRTKMMRELFPLDRFDLREPVSRLHAETKTAITALEGRLQELTEYSPEKMKALEQELATHQQNIKKKKAYLSEQETALKKAAELKKLNAAFIETQNQIAELNQQKSGIDMLKRQVDTFEKVRLRYGAILQRLSEIEQEIERLKKQEQIQEQELQAVGEKMKQAQTRHKEILDQNGDEENHRQQITGAEKALDIKSSQKAIEHLNEQLQQERENLEKIEEEWTKRKKERNEKQQSLLKIREQLPDESALYALQNSFKEEDNLRQRLKTAQEEHESVHRLIEELKTQRIEIVKSVAQYLQLRKPYRELMLSEARLAFQESIENKKVTLEELQTLKSDLDVKSGLAAHAESLKPGEKCPLCGATEHPEPYSDEALTKEKHDVQEQIDAQQKHREALNEALIQLNGLEDRFKKERDQIKSREKQVEEAKKLLSQCIEDRENLSVQFSRDQLTVALESLKQQKTEVQKLEQSIQQLDQQLEDQSNIETLKQKIQEKTNKMAGLESRIELQKGEVEESWLTLSAGQLQAKQKDVRESLEKLFELTSGIQELEKQYQRLEVELSGTNKQLKAQQELKSERESEINEQLKVDGFKDRSTITGILAQAIDIDESRKKIETFYQQLHTNEARLKELEKEIGDQQFDEESYRKLEKQVSEQREHLSQMETKTGELQSQIKVLKEKLQLKLQHTKDLEIQEKRKSNLDVLSRLFRGDGFVKYVSQIYLEQLCTIANERFKQLTHNQLELGIDEKYNFIVRDFLHDGRTRLLKTLSGGQTFQAALSLAMALSEQIQQYHKVKQQFFFMDEGFGSLDRESLSLVFDTLKQLRKEQRIVGIISHVEELQTEIDRYLMVENDDEEGSKIKFVG